MTTYELTVRPIDVWPDGWRSPGRERKPNPFRVTSYEATLDLLDRELDQIDATTAHLQLDVDAGQVRRDGYLRSGAKVRHPGVILTVDTRRLGVLTYPCDTFERRYSGDPPDWQINTRAIALGLEALRKVERYGIAERGQQYAGFKALGAGAPVAVGAAMTVDEAARLLAATAWPGEPEDRRAAWQGRMVTDADLLARTFRAAIRRSGDHPDAGGDGALFRRLAEARDLIVAERERRS